MDKESEPKVELCIDDGQGVTLKWSCALRMIGLGCLIGDSSGVLSSKGIEHTHSGGRILHKKLVNVFFFIFYIYKFFMEEFRWQFKGNNLDVKHAAIIGKAGEEKWRSMFDDEKTASVKKAQY